MHKIISLCPENVCIINNISIKKYNFCTDNSYTSGIYRFKTKSTPPLLDTL